LKHITLIRHAKSSWKDASLPDIDRPLNKRGKRDAPLMGKVLKEKRHIPDQIIASPAKRALDTAHVIADILGFCRDTVNIDPVIYHGDVADHLARIRHLNDRLEHVYWIGHNPSLTLMARWLSGDPVENIPTCGVFSVTFNVESWQHVGEDVGQLNFFDYPKNHAST
jgi:phosphohistidine phosphatase